MSMVRSVLEYASPVWFPSTKHNISILEMVQRRAERFVLNYFSRYSSVSRILNQLRWPMLKQRRNEAEVTDLEFNINQIRGHPFKLIVE